MQTHTFYGCCVSTHKHSDTCGSQDGGLLYVCSFICAPYEDGVERLARVVVI